MTMKIAVCYRGIFRYGSLFKNGVYKNTDNILLLKESIKHNNITFYDLLYECGNQLDYHISTYDLDKNINDVFSQQIKPKSYSFIDKSFLTNPSVWKVQFKHIQNLISNVRNYESLTREKYDLFIFTRPDIKYLVDYNSMNLDSNKFNIVIEHLSGNCDDFLWIFPQKYLDIFEECINYLNDQSYAITHEINHILKKNGVDINYMQSYDETTVLGSRIYTSYNEPFNQFIEKDEWEVSKNEKNNC